ncbi:MAG: hypothetical protein ACRC4M_03280 [Mycoplasma sp.]
MSEIILKYNKEELEAFKENIEVFFECFPKIEKNDVSFKDDTVTIEAPKKIIGEIILFLEETEPENLQVDLK